jgi:rRNA maturation protein Nop10
MKLGDIADMMLDGTMCQVCGQWMEFDEPPGYPVTCAGCGGDVMDSEPAPVNVKDPKEVACPDPFCERKFRNRKAAAQHWIDAHET